MNERFFRTKFLENYSFFTERTILLNERLYWMIVQCENEQNRWKMNDNFENYQNNFFNDGKNGSFKNYERTKGKICQTHPSLTVR